MEKNVWVTGDWIGVGESTSIFHSVPSVLPNHLQGACVISRIAAMTKIPIASAAIGFSLLIVGLAIAQAPKRNISAARHPNLAAAQRLSQNAYEKIVAAQEANEWDMQGHAQKAKELLEQANNQLKMAAEAANRNKK